MVVVKMIKYSQLIHWFGTQVTQSCVGDEVTRLTNELKSRGSISVGFRECVDNAIVRILLGLVLSPVLFSRIVFLQLVKCDYGFRVKSRSLVLMSSIA